MQITKWGSETSRLLLDVLHSDVPATSSAQATSSTLPELSFKQLAASAGILLRHRPPSTAAHATLFAQLFYHVLTLTLHQNSHDCHTTS